jgi:hypothetical protein
VNRATGEPATSGARGMRGDLHNVRQRPRSALTEAGVGPLHGRRFVVADDLWCSLHGGSTRLQLLGELGQPLDGLLIEDIAGEAPVPEVLSAQSSAARGDSPRGRVGRRSGACCSPCAARRHGSAVPTGGDEAGR